MKSILLSLLWLLACTDSQTTQTETTSTAPNTDPSSCFEKYSGKLDELITREDILSVYTSGIDSAELKYYRTGPVEYHSCTYEWKSDRTVLMKIGGFERSIPKPNRIGIWGLRIYDEKIEDPLAHFKNNYRTPTAEEKAYMQRAMKEKMEEENLSAPQKEVGTDLTTSTMDKIQFETVDGIGDAAAWDFMDNALVILVGRSKFKVIVDISDDKDENLGIAKKLAGIILKKCA